MRINGLNGANTPVGGMNMTKATDSVSKNIQNQIANAQKQLQELSANKDMSIEEKMKKRQEIQQQITDLNNQLRQHQIEQRKEQQAKKSSMDDMLGGSKKTAPKAGKQSTGLSQASMKAMISADSAMAQAQVQGSVATKMEGRAGVLESEIKLDSARGDDVEAKKEELAEVEQKAVQAESAQMNTLATANKELEEAAKADQQTEKADDKDKKTDKKDAVAGEKEDKTVAGTEETENVGADVKTETVNTDIAEPVEVSVPETVAYTHVDVRLQEVLTMSEINSFSDYASKYNTNVDYSYLFGGMQTPSTGSAFNLSDYAAIKNGSYGKLLKAYYAKQDAEKASSGGDTVQKSTLMKSGADALKKSADALNNDELWEKKKIKKKDEKTGEEIEVEDYDWEAITKAVKSFVEDYNDVVEQAGNSNSKDVLRNAVWMTGITESNENMLSKIGITVGKGNKLELDEEALKKADISSFKTLFTGHNSFADKVSMKANSISNAAARTSGTYKSNGTYNNALSELVSKKVDEEVQYCNGFVPIQTGFRQVFIPIGKDN